MKTTKELIEQFDTDTMGFISVLDTKDEKIKELGEFAQELCAGYPLYCTTSNNSYQEYIALAIVLGYKQALIDRLERRI